MAAETKKPDLDTRGYALGLFVESDKGVMENSLSAGVRRHVDVMKTAGWLEAVGGALFLNDAGRRAVEDLRPASMPRLTDAQEEVLLDVMEKGGGGFDLNYAPGRRLLAYGALDVKRQRFGGYWFTPTDRAREWKASAHPEEAADALPSAPKP